MYDKWLNSYYYPLNNIIYYLKLMLNNYWLLGTYAPPPPPITIVTREPIINNAQIKLQFGVQNNSPSSVSKQTRINWQGQFSYIRLCSLKHVMEIFSLSYKIKSLLEKIHYLDIIEENCFQYILWPIINVM